MINLSQFRTPREIQQDLCKRFIRLRKIRKLSQQQLAEKAGVSLGSLKRFEQTSEISLASLVKLACVLDAGQEFDDLLQQPHFNSIEEVIRASRQNHSRNR